jgi:hypothetical protein
MVFAALREPLPNREAGLAYLVWANMISQREPNSRHPFDSDVGIARLHALLRDRDPDYYAYAACAAKCIAFVNADARPTLFERADGHSDADVLISSAEALAKTGSEFGPHRLAHLCLNPRFADRAIESLESLEPGKHIPTKARDPDFLAMAEMCTWLAYPTEFGRPPDEIALYDTRELNWPPTNDHRRLWLFKYRYEPQGDDPQREGIGLVGSTTFSLFPQTKVDLSPEDVYGLHCCWELEIQEDNRAPKKGSAAIGRKLLAAANRDFPAA